MNTISERPQLEHIASKVLMEMYSTNQDYIQRLTEIKNLHKVICRLIQNDHDTTGLNSLMQTNIHAINKWLEDLEQWQTMIDQAELKDHLDSLACGIYDDYEFYEAECTAFRKYCCNRNSRSRKVKSNT